MLNRNENNSSNEFLTLNLVFKTDLSKEEESAITSKNMLKSLCFFSTGLMALSYSLSRYFYSLDSDCEQEYNDWVISAEATTYGVASIWIFMHLWDEWMLDQFSEQAISRNKDLLVQHFFSTVVGCATGIASYYAGGSSPIGNALFASLANTCTCYYLFGFKNNIFAFADKKVAQSAVISSAFSQIIEKAIPALFNTKKAERKVLISAIYNSADNKNLCLIALLKQFKALEPNESVLFKNNENKKASPILVAISFSLFFNLINFFAICAYYYSKKCVIYGYDFYYSCWYKSDSVMDCEPGGWGWYDEVIIQLFNHSLYFLSPFSCYKFFTLNF